MHLDFLLSEVVFSIGKQCDEGMEELGRIISRVIKKD